MRGERYGDGMDESVEVYVILAAGMLLLLATIGMGVAAGRSRRR
ncbi:hypothetical protein Microterr_23040 [Microbacterium terricola]|uniref:LPXTG cell wall anchor domain-containing protein n=1 Tax=Microbacterium terricola TaxID=344163 RepID=A0ABM8E127_9MICO|nr:hypothetical protein Microterr_23040 [Microbacterium terricola]